MWHLGTHSGEGTWAERADMGGGDSDSTPGLRAGISHQVHLKEF